MDTTILTIAKVARIEMEKFARRKDLHEYNNLDLACLCAISSWFTVNLAGIFDKKIQCATGFYDNSYGKYDTPEGCINHAWNVYRDTIIDLTATQFDTAKITHKKVHITTVNDPTYTFVTWINGKSDFNEWPCDQNPYEFEYDLNKHKRIAIAKLRKKL